jgi:SAM-dependent methyltransferase
MERATSFGTIAADYDRYRPAPPAAVAEWLLPEGAQRVADVCAGTGGCSRVLARRVEEVVAVDLDTRMVALAGPAVRQVCGRGEALPIRTSALDAVLVSSGWHWLDEEAAVAEAARVLRPGGVLGVLWNGPARHVEWVGELLGRTRSDGDAPRRPRSPRRELRIPAEAPFRQPQTWQIEWSLTRTRSELIGLAGTYSRFITLPPDEQDRMTRRAAEVARIHPPLVDLPMTTRGWKAVRR